MPIKPTWEKFLLEMPIDKLEVDKSIDKYKNDPSVRMATYGVPDAKLLMNPKGIQKIKDTWGRVSWLFDIYVVADSGIIPQKSTDPEKITVYFFQNLSNITHQVHPLTGWMIAHRIGHELFDDFVGRGAAKMFNSAIYQVWAPWSKTNNSATKSTPFLNFLMDIGTFRSARNRMLSSTVEFDHECFAQFLLNGSIQLKRPTNIDDQTWSDIEELRKQTENRFRMELNKRKGTTLEIF